MNLRFEQITNEHKDLILKWLKAPHVAEYFYGDGLKNTIRNIELFCKGINNNGDYTFYHWIAFCDDAPFAFIMTSPIVGPYNPEHDYDKWYIDGKKTFTLDLLIGETKFLGKGLAHTMIQQFILDQYPDVDFFLIDPATDNTKAVHVYEKAGFQKVAEFKPEYEHNPKPHLMMRLDVDELRRKVN